MKSELKMEVLAACRAQLLAGKPLTVRSVRDAVGRGSNADIGPLVKQFNEQKQTALPEDLSALVLSAGERVWHQAQESFAKTIAAMHAVASAERESSEGALESIRVELSAANDAVDEAKKKIAELEDELRDARKLPAQLVKAQERADKAAQSRIDRLSRKIELLQEQHEKGVSEIGELRGQLKVAGSAKHPLEKTESKASHVAG